MTTPMGRFSAAAQAVCETAQEQLGGWIPDSGLEFDAMLAALPGMWETFQQIFHHMASTLGEHGSNHPVVHEMEEAASNFQGMQEAFQHVYDVHRVEHAEQMRRYEDPNPGEETFDVRGHI